MLVTIGITTYDRVDLLEDTINSVLNQTFSDFRIIVANDNPKRVLSFDNLQIPRDVRVEIVNHKTNLGEIDNLNWLLNQASTPYFTWLADDDLLHPRFLELLSTELLNHPTCKAVYTNYVSGATPSHFFWESPVSKHFESFDTQEFLTRYSSRSLTLIGCYGLFELEQLRKMGGFKRLGSGYSPGADTLIPILLSGMTQIDYLDHELVFFRSHPESMSIYSDNLDSFISAEIDFIKYATEAIDKCPPDSRRVIYSQFRMWFQDNHFTVAQRQGGTRVLSLLVLFTKSEFQNFALFQKFDIGLLLDIQFFASAIRRLAKRVLGDYVFPKMRRKVVAFLKR